MVAMPDEKGKIARTFSFDDVCGPLGWGGNPLYKIDRFLPEKEKVPDGAGCIDNIRFTAAQEQQRQAEFIKKMYNLLQSSESLGVKAGAALTVSLLLTKYILKYNTDLSGSGLPSLNEMRNDTRQYMQDALLEVGLKLRTGSLSPEMRCGYLNGVQKISNLIAMYPDIYSDMNAYNLAGFKNQSDLQEELDRIRAHIPAQKKPVKSIIDEYEEPPGRFYERYSDKAAINVDPAPLVPKSRPDMQVS